MDSIYEKYKKLILKYKELSNLKDPSKDEALYLRQEMRRCEHILYHHNSAHFNYAGRSIGTTMFGAFGLFLGLCVVPVYLPKIKNNYISVIYCMILLGGFGIIGYNYAKYFHSSPNEAVKNKLRINDFIEEYKDIIKESEDKIEDKLKKK